MQIGKSDAAVGISKIYIDLEGFLSTIPAAHPRHQRLFPVEQLPRTESFNPDEPQGVSWVKTLPKLVSSSELEQACS